jgi:hypothetical protein
MLAQLLGKHGLAARVEGSDILAANRIVPLEAAEVRMVCLSFLDTTTPVHVRYAVRRIRRRLPGARILVGSWGADADQAAPLCAAARSDGCVTSLTEAVRFCLDQARLAAAEGPREESEPEHIMAQASAA